MIQPVINSSNQVTDVPIKFVTEVNLKTTTVSAMLQTKDFLIIGCGDCDSYNGRIEFFDRSSLSKLLTINGDTNNTQLGLDL